jgi:hypothetical protein
VLWSMLAADGERSSKRTVSYRMERFALAPAAVMVDTHTQAQQVCRANNSITATKESGNVPKKCAYRSKRARSFSGGTPSCTELAAWAFSRTKSTAHR